MIQAGEEEFFIEPWDQMTGGDEEKEEEGRRHIVYRSSAIKKKTTVTQTEAFNDTADDFVRGEVG